MTVRSEFDHVKLSDDGQAKALDLRVKFSELLTAIEVSTAGPTNNVREVALAKTNLQQASQWTMKALSLQVVNQALPALATLVALGCALLPSVAWAQDAISAVPLVPSAQAENWMQTILGIVFTGFLFPAGKAAVEWVRAQTAAKGHETALKVATDLATSEAAFIHQRLNEAAADGKITREEVEAIGRELIGKLPEQTREVLQAHFGEGLISWIAGRILDSISLRKKADAAAAAAVLTVDTKDEAMAARRARALAPGAP